MNRREFLALCAAVPLAAALPTGPNVQPIQMAAWAFDPAIGSWYCKVPTGETITDLKEAFGELYVFTDTAVYQVPELPDRARHWMADWMADGAGWRLKTTAISNAI